MSKDEKRDDKFIAYIKKITTTGKVYLKFTSKLKESILVLKRRL